MPPKARSKATSTQMHISKVLAISRISRQPQTRNPNPCPSSLSPLSLSLFLSSLSFSRSLAISHNLTISQSRNLLSAGLRRGITSSASASICPFKLTIRSRSCSKAWPRSFSTRARRTNFTSFSTGYQSPFVPEKHINPGFICLIYFFDVLPDEYTGETMKIGSMLWLTTR